MRGNSYKYEFIKLFLDKEYNLKFEIYDELPQHQKLRWLINEDGRPLEIDLICKRNKIGIEINGSQHYHPVAFDGNEQLSIERFSSQLENDKVKEKLLASHGWKLIVLPDDMPLRKSVILNKYIKDIIFDTEPVLLHFNSEEYNLLYNMAKNLETNYPDNIIDECSIKVGIPSLIKEIIRNSLKNRNKEIKITKCRYTNIDRKVCYTTMNIQFYKMLIAMCEKYSIVKTPDEKIKIIIDNISKEIDNKIEAVPKGLKFDKHEFIKSTAIRVYFSKETCKTLENSRESFGISSKRTFLESIIFYQYAK